MKTSRGFTLVEILAVAFIATIIVGVIVPPALSSFVTRQRIAKEDAVLAQLKADIETSFEARDLDLFNVSALPGQIDAGVHATEFSTTTVPVYPSITGYEWFARIGRARGFAVTTGQPVSKSSQPALYDLTFTDADRPRLLLIDPAHASDPARARYLLISLVASAEELTLPPFQNTPAWFNAIWDTPWERYDTTLPAAWTAALSGPEVARWNADTPGKTRLHRLRVVRITQRKHDIVVNSNHPTDWVWVSWNNDDKNYQLAPDTGAWMSPTTVLAGRVLSVDVGNTTRSSAKKTEITVRERVAITAQ